MYKDFFGLRAYPFQLSPDPSFLYPSKGHSRAIAFLRYGLFKEEGFIVITGDVGAGKTTLLRSLIGSVSQAEVVVGQIVHTRLDADDLLRSVLVAFNLRHENLTKTGMLQSLEQFFQFQHRARKRVLLVVDEVQNLPPEALEELRMLSNFHADGVPLLQTFLLGQPEFRRTMRLPEFSQLLQRVIASYHLGPLEADEIKAYVEFRLEKAGRTDAPNFADDAFGAIYKHTAGIPRRINTLCDRVMLSAYLDQTKDIDGARVETVARELGEELGVVDAPTLAPVDESPRVYEPSLAGVMARSHAEHPTGWTDPVAPHHAPLGLSTASPDDSLDGQSLTPQYQQSLSRLEQTLEATRRALRNLMYPGVKR